MTEDAHVPNSLNSNSVRHERASGAPSGFPDDWEALDWASIERQVQRLQARIVEAIKLGKYGKVKALQRLLTRSFVGRALAVKRVTENKGKHTPGVDGVLWMTPREKMDAVHSLKPRGYKPLPLRRVNIPKSKGKTRPLGIPAMKDRAMQALYLLALDPIAESKADSRSFGFRKTRSCADALEYVFRSLCKRNSPSWVLEGDIKACFDNICHHWLLDHVPLERSMLHKWLQAGYIENQTLFPTNAGTPQGGIISPVLANLALDGLQEKLLLAFPKQASSRRKGFTWTNPKVNLIRYADDFVITGSSQELLENQVKPLVQEFLAARGMELSPQKTLITHIEGGFDFLGQNVRRYHDQAVLLTPAKKNVAAFLEDVREVLKRNRAAKTYDVIVLLNPIIRGWVNYHRHACSKRTFSDVDKQIFKAVWAWAKRRHPNKSKHWVVAHYFGSVGGNHWRFFGSSKDALGQNHTEWLLLAASVPIVRHIPIKACANPYDLLWSPYYEQRKLLSRAAKAATDTVVPYQDVRVGKAKPKGYTGQDNRLIASLTSIAAATPAVTKA